MREAFPKEQPGRDINFPLTEIVPVPTTGGDIPNPAIIIGPDPLDEDNLPGSHPLEDDSDSPKPHLNS